MPPNPNRFPARRGIGTAFGAGGIKAVFYCAFPPVLMSERVVGVEMERNNKIAGKSKGSVWIRLSDLGLETFAPTI